MWEKKGGKVASENLIHLPEVTLEQGRWGIIVSAAPKQEECIPGGMHITPKARHKDKWEGKISPR